MDKLIDTLVNLMPYKPERETIRMMLDAGDTVEYKAKKHVVKAGDRDTNIYMIIEGLARMSYFNGQIEVTYGFGNEGTFFLSPKGFCAGEEAVYSIVAVTDVKMLRLPKEKWLQLMDSSHDFCKWMLHLCMYQFYASELKTEHLQGTAEEKLQNLEKNSVVRDLMSLDGRHPDVVRLVPSNVLASYLGITQSYLSNIRKKIRKKRP